jgi:sugar transferase (PEP-CTERM/EpsH1 system associated)
MEKGIASCASRSSSRFEHVVVCLTKSGRAEKLFPPSTTVREIRKPPGNSPQTLIKVARELRRFRPCVVHTRNWAGIDGVIAARLAGIKGVLHGEHGWEVDDLHGKNRRRMLIRRHLSGFTAGFTCVSKHIASWLSESVKVRCPVTQIYNGVDTDTFRPVNQPDALRAELGLSRTARLIGHVGRLVDVKDHDTLFRAFEAVRREYTEAVLVCVGDGPRESELRSRAGPSIRILGHRTDIVPILAALEVFVLPSLNEGISNTILEAMAVGIPVVATDVGGNAELVEEGVTGRLVRVGDDPAIAAAIAAYLANTGTARAHGRAGRESVMRRFSVKAMVEGYERVWRECAHHHIA